jgi:hypothetical protein
MPSSHLIAFIDSLLPTRRGGLVLHRTTGRKLTAKAKLALAIPPLLQPMIQEIA